MPNPLTRRCLLKYLTSVAAAGMVRLPMQGLWLPQS